MRLIAAIARRYFTLIKYILTSVLVYAYVFLAIFALVELMRLKELYAYVTVYLTAYALEYTVTLRLVFEERHKWVKVLKYLTYVAVFLLFSSYAFQILVSSGVHYIFATLAVAVVLMPARFIVNKYWVYK